MCRLAPASFSWKILLRGGDGCRRIIRQLPVMVNIPGFRLRVFSDDHTTAFANECCGGEGAQSSDAGLCQGNEVHHLPAYWNLPLDITRAEIVPKLQRTRATGEEGLRGHGPEWAHRSRRSCDRAILGWIKSGRLLITAKARAAERAWLGSNSCFPMNSMYTWPPQGKPGPGA